MGAGAIATWGLDAGCVGVARGFGADGTEDKAVTGFAIVAATGVDGEGGTFNTAFDAGGVAMGGLVCVDGTWVIGTWAIGNSVSGACATGGDTGAIRTGPAVAFEPSLFTLTCPALRRCKK